MERTTGTRTGRKPKSDPADRKYSFRLNAEENKELAQPEMRQRLEATDNVPTGGKAADFAKQIEAESKANAQIIKAAKIQLN